MRLVIYSTCLALHASLGHAEDNSSVALFGKDGPQPMDVATVVTDSGWFELPTMALVTTSASIFASMLTDVNSTHADVTWIGPFATANSSSITVTIRKRSWDDQGGYAWPAAVYDAYLALGFVQAANSEPVAMYAQAIALNATQLFSALIGHSLTMTSCPSTAINQSFLVWQNTATGLVTEAVTQLIASNGTIKVVQNVGNSVVATQADASIWLPQCVLAWIPVY